MSSAIALRCYRALLRVASSIGHDQGIKQPLTDAQWGTHRLLRPEAQAQQTDIIQALLPGLPPDTFASGPASSSSGSLAADQSSAGPSKQLPLSRLISLAFRSSSRVPPDQQQPLVDEAFKALRLLLEQQYLARCSSSCTTDGVRVDVTSKYDQSAIGFPGDKVHVFTYRVRVTNLRSDTIKILGRSWTIKNERGQVRVHLPLEDNNAVVGQQPILPPGYCFEYHSGTDLDTMSGLQNGSLLVDAFGDGKGRPATQRLTVQIAPFPLLHPNAFMDGKI